jgi:hypothetical protein
MLQPFCLLRKAILLFFTLEAVKASGWHCAYSNVTGSSSCSVSGTLQLPLANTTGQQPSTIVGTDANATVLLRTGKIGVIGDSAMHKSRHSPSSFCLQDLTAAATAP